jgi:hypothetical protein
VLPPTLVQSQLAKNANITDAERLKAINDVRGALLTAVGVLALFSSSLVAYLNFRGTLELNRRGQVTDRFGKAIDQLGKGEQLDVRIGGIYALEQIARDSEDLHWPIVEVLTAFVREHTTDRSSAQPGVREFRPIGDTFFSYIMLAPDIQAAVTVLGRRDASRDLGLLDLNDSNLPSANLPEANLQSARLGGADLQGAGLMKANLQGAGLRKANLQGAYLREANLHGASLSEANLRSAIVLGANLEGADLEGRTSPGPTSRRPRA